MAIVNSPDDATSARWNSEKVESPCPRDSGELAVKSSRWLASNDSGLSRCLMENISLSAAAWDRRLPFRVGRPDSGRK
jgi:hypothetical protein